jgi:hypothetical protein
LRFASPATISRMGMIYLNNEDININSIINKWKRDKNVDTGSKLSDLTEQFLKPC